jgi:AraC-like DNA-binding protein
MIQTPEFMPENPMRTSAAKSAARSATVDVLGDVLKVLRAQGAVFLCADFTAPWGVVSPPARELARMLSLPADHCVEFHLVAKGNCWVTVHGQPPVELLEGDMLLLPCGHEHILASSPTERAVPAERIIPPPPHAGIIRLAHGGAGSPTRLLCGYLQCDSRFEPLLESLPPMLHVRSRGAGAGVSPAGPLPCGTRQCGTAPLPESAGNWLENTLHYIITEASAPGARDASMLSRFTELMFVEVLRRYMGEAATAERGWLCAVHDPQIGRALQALHAEPARPWSVDELARHAGVSRSAFAERFTTLIRRTPMRYLAEWRMQIAQSLLRDVRLSVAQVASRVGYESEFAFNRAFKRHAGRPPAAWRKERASASVA